MVSITSDQYWKSEAYVVQHIGWLLSSDAPTNRAKGEKLLAQAPLDVQAKSLAKEQELRQEMATLRSK